MRNTFVQEITNIAQKNKKIVLLAGDIGYKLFDNFKKKYPHRFYNCGVAEANMTTVAAGLALKGFTPITYTIATFNVYKTLEQIKQVLIDYKGCGKSEQRQEIINLINQAGLKVIRTSEIEK